VKTHEMIWVVGLRKAVDHRSDSGEVGDLGIGGREVISLSNSQDKKS
jgi:hypothetical protein